jgi:hypothetical protein
MEEPSGQVRFNLSVGGFLIKHCHWYPGRGQVLFPRRYDTNGNRHKVVFAHGRLVDRLRGLLESGETALPRDRTPCALGIHSSYFHTKTSYLSCITVSDSGLGCLLRHKSAGADGRYAGVEVKTAGHAARDT